MSLDGSKVIVPGVGHFYRCSVGTPAPDADDIDNPTIYTIVISGSPTGGTFTVTVGDQTTSGQAQNVAAATLKSALEALSTVGSGNATVTLSGTTYTIKLDVSPTVVSVNGAGLTGGSSPAATLTVEYAEIGHTDSDSPLQVNRGGGDVTTLGSWQASDLDSSTADITWALAFSLLQYDADNLKLYYGSNANVNEDGSVDVPLKPAATECGLFLVISNGGKRAWRYYDRVNIIAADGENFDTTKLGAMPVQATILAADGVDKLFTVSPVMASA